MKKINIYCFLYLPDTQNEILGFSKNLEFYNLPVFVNFTNYQLGIINYLNFRNVKQIAIFLHEDQRNLAVQTKDFHKYEQIQYEYIYDIEDKNNLLELLNNSINRIQIDNSEKNYILVAPVFYKGFLDLGSVDYSHVIYKCDYEKGQDSLYLVEMNYFKRVLKSLKTIDNFSQFALMFSKVKYEELNPLFFSYPFNSLKGYLYAHFKLLDKEGLELRKLISYIGSFFHHLPQTLIEEKGYVKNSIIGYNCEIKGEIEDSVIFNNVHCHPSSKIINSIILPGNVIGKGAYIKNAVIGYQNNPNKMVTIGNNCEIGKSFGKSYENSRYKEILPDGYSLIGNEINLPSGFKVGKNCVIQGNVNYTELKKMNSLIDGGTIES